jgi:hypothetical protein
MPGSQSTLSAAHRRAISHLHHLVLIMADIGLLSPKVRTRYPRQLPKASTIIRVAGRRITKWHVLALLISLLRVANFRECHF